MFLKDMYVPPAHLFKLNFYFLCIRVVLFQIRSSPQILGMSVLRMEELRAQLTHAERVIVLLDHITGFLFCLHRYNSMCRTPVFAFL